MRHSPVTQQQTAAEPLGNSLRRHDPNQVNEKGKSLFRRGRSLELPLSPSGGLPRVRGFNLALKNNFVNGLEERKSKKMQFIMYCI